MNIHVLAVTAKSRHRKLLAAVLEELDQARCTVDEPARLWDHLNSGDVDLVVVDRKSLSEKPDIVVAAIRKLPEQPEVIALTEEDDPELRSALLAAGCMAVLPVTSDPGPMQETLGALVDRRQRDMTRQIGAEGRPKRASLQDFISDSPVMQQFMSLVQRIVNSDSSLLLLGETGVGKERLGGAIHYEGRRRNGPFVCINCAALPETLLESELFGHERGAFTGATRTRRGYFELAHGGTIFLDEIAELPPHLQAKLLRVLEERTIQRLGGESVMNIDVRLMAATNRDLEAEVAAGRFRTDLYYRLAVVTLRLPPLRERKEDIPGLVSSYLGHFGVVFGGRPHSISRRALAALVEYSWPGNVRELINIIERTCLVAPGEEIDIGDLPPGVVEPVSGPPGSAGNETPGAEEEAEILDSTAWRGRTLAEARDELLARFHRRYLGTLLAENEGRIGDTARAAAVSPRTLYALMRKNGLRKEDYRKDREEDTP